MALGHLEPQSTGYGQRHQRPSAADGREPQGQLRPLDLCADLDQRGLVSTEVVDSTRCMRTCHCMRRRVCSSCFSLQLWLWVSHGFPLRGVCMQELSAEVQRGTSSLLEDFKEEKSKARLRQRAPRVRSTATGLQRIRVVFPPWAKETTT